MALPLVSSRVTDQAESRCKASLPAAPPRLLALWHLASLDAPTVAVVWTLAFAWIARVHLDPWIPLLIACGTWTVYVGDRLLDARRAIRSGDLALLRERHYFHWRHRRSLVPIAGCSAAIAVTLVLRLMPVTVREHDSVIAGAALAYFSGVHSRANFPAWLRRIASKEFFVGVLFTAGCAAPALSCLRAGGARVWYVLACVGLFAALAWLNCTAIERWEARLDSSSIQKPAVLISVIAGAIALAFSVLQIRASGLLCMAALGALLLLLLDRSRQRLAPLALRALADLVLLTPVLLLTLGAIRR